MDEEKHYPEGKIIVRLKLHLLSSCMHTTPQAASPTCGGPDALTACRLSPEAVRKVACVSVTPAEADTCTSNVAGPTSLQNSRAQQQASSKTVLFSWRLASGFPLGATLEALLAPDAVDACCAQVAAWP